MQLLIDGGANIHARDRDGNTALNIAERKGFTRIKALLLAQSEANVASMQGRRS